MNIRITTLSENTASYAGLLAEHGLSILVETDTVNILFDTGLSISVCHNADTLGIDLGKIDKIVLSHGHLDHTGGLREILKKIHKKIEIIAHPDIWAAKYGGRKGQEFRYIGIPFQRRELESLGAEFNLTTKPVVITDKIMTTGEVPMVTDFEKIDPSLFVKGDADFEPDKFLDDQALILNTESGLVVIPGCAHHGVINTLYHAQQITGVKQIAMVLGGWHLTGTTEERIWQTIAALRELGVERIGVSHCTGLPASVILAHEFGDNFFFNNTGTRIELPEDFKPRK
jgi:7,8-dihydropterin-6-yl-methyl-4-(beta-D-ribofuranosyl)aminobenzene 5'-phosphate synthase